MKVLSFLSISSIPITFILRSRHHHFRIVEIFEKMKKGFFKSLNKKVMASKDTIKIAMDISLI